MTKRAEELAQLHANEFGLDAAEEKTLTWAFMQYGRECIEAAAATIAEQHLYDEYTGKNTDMLAQNIREMPLP